MQQQQAKEILQQIKGPEGSQLLGHCSFGKVFKLDRLINGQNQTVARKYYAFDYRFREEFQVLLSLSSIHCECLASLLTSSVED